MSKLITSTVVCERGGLSIGRVLGALEKKGWIAYQDGMPFVFSISDVDLTEETMAFTSAEVDGALGAIQSRIDNGKQFSLSLSIESRGTISIVGERRDLRWVLSCHYSCSGLDLDEKLMNLNAAADFFVRPLLDDDFKIAEYAVAVVS